MALPLIPLAAGAAGLGAGFWAGSSFNKLALYGGLAGAAYLAWRYAK